MSEKEKGSDSGIEIPRKSEGSAGSFAGVDKSSWNDFDDSGQGSSRRATFDDDDDYDDDDVEKRVDLDAFMADNGPPGDDVGDEEGEDEEEEDGGSEDEDEEENLDDEGEEENEEEFETEEEEEDGTNETGPSDEILTNIETSSIQQLAIQREQNKKKIKEKKKALINEYLHDVKHFNHLRTKNVLLGLKIITHIDQKQAVVEKYVQQEIEERERLKEDDRLKRLQMMGKCDKKGKKGKQLTKNEKRPKKKKKSKNARFSTSQPGSAPIVSSMDPEVKVLLRRKFNIIAEDIPDVSLNKLNKDWMYNTTLLQEKGVEFKPLFSRKDACKRQKYLRERIGRRLRRFSFMRSQFYSDVPKAISKKKTVDLMNLNIDKLRSKSSKYLDSHESPTSTTVSLTDTNPKPNTTTNPLPSRRMSLAKINRSMHGPDYGSGRRRKFAVTKEALGLARSKSRMALDHHKREQQIRMNTDPDEYKNLHHFKFEFADPRLSAKQASMRLRDELIKLLQMRNIPTEQLKWPLEVKGVEFEGKNPYGRVSLNYTRLSQHEKEFPHTAYRILLTNIAFLKTKQQRLGYKHRKNMVELKNQRQVLDNGLRQIFIEIVEGLRIWVSLCGISDTEKKEARNATNSFVKELERFFDEFLTEMLVKLYKCIHASEFALRKLWISEGKGEGAELHEFKEIMRGREKLKAEHKNMENSISRYQRHSNRVLKVVKNSGKKLREAQDYVGKMNSELDHLKGAVNTVIKGMYFCQETYQEQQLAEKALKTEAGIMSSPALSEDYNRIVTKIEDAKAKRLDLQLQYNSKVREMEKIMPSRFVRYKLRS